MLPPDECDAACRREYAKIQADNAMKRSGNGGDGGNGGLTMTWTWRKPAMTAVPIPGAPQMLSSGGFGCAQKASCYNLYDWTDTIVRAATGAGIDPQLLYSVLMIEVGRSDDLYPIDNTVQFGS